MEGVLVARVNSAPALLAGAFFSDVIRHAPRENCESQIARRFSLFGDVWLSFAATFSTVSGDAAIATAMIPFVDELIDIRLADHNCPDDQFTTWRARIREWPFADFRTD